MTTARQTLDPYNPDKSAGPAPPYSCSEPRSSPEPSASREPRSRADYMTSDDDRHHRDYLQALDYYIASVRAGLNALRLELRDESAWGSRRRMILESSGGNL